MDIDSEKIFNLLNDIKFIEKTYDVVRIVDPIKKKVMSVSGNKIIETNFVCHDFWNRAKGCDNCISLRAFNENDVFIKIEYNEEKIYMVLAMPVKIYETTVVVELFKDVSKNMSIVKKDKGNEVDIRGFIGQVDNLLFKDHLTGIFNRRFIDERLPVDIINNSLNKSSLSIIMADIDLFKTVNDTYGHLAGDYVLKEIAKILVSCIRTEKDWVARYGGEEFLVCCPDTDKDGATVVAERMRKKIENKVFQFEGVNITLTTSFGVHAIDNNESSLETLIGFADENLYKAKNSGRNKVISS